MNEFDMYYKINKRNICMILGNHLAYSQSKSIELRLTISKTACCTLKTYANTRKLTATQFIIG